MSDHSLWQGPKSVDPTNHRFRSLSALALNEAARPFPLSTPENFGRHSSRRTLGSAAIAPIVHHRSRSGGIGVCATTLIGRHDHDAVH
jgi:hypothetical protein